MGATNPTGRGYSVDENTIVVILCVVLIVYILLTLIRYLATNIYDYKDLTEESETVTNIKNSQTQDAEEGPATVLRTVHVQIPRKSASLDAGSSTGLNNRPGDERRNNIGDTDRTSTHATNISLYSTGVSQPGTTGGNSQIPQSWCDPTDGDRRKGGRCDNSNNEVRKESVNTDLTLNSDTARLLLTDITRELLSKFQKHMCDSIHQNLQQTIATAALDSPIRIKKHIDNIVEHNNIVVLTSPSHTIDDIIPDNQIEDDWNLEIDVPVPPYTPPNPWWMILRRRLWRLCHLVRILDHLQIPAQTQIQLLTHTGPMRLYMAYLRDMKQIINTICTIALLIRLYIQCPHHFQQQ